jgi:hypothetical protein
VQVESVGVVLVERWCRLSAGAGGSVGVVLVRALVQVES